MAGFQLGSFLSWAAFPAGGAMSRIIAVLAALLLAAIALAALLLAAPAFA